MLTLQNIIKTAKSKGYNLHTEPERLNIIGVRTDNPINQNSFDDKIAFFYYDKEGKLHGKVASATTDPSTHFLNEPISEKGTAILKSGEYINAYSIGLHRGLYPALIQQKPVTVWRDNDRDGFTNIGGTQETGMYGINIHKASIKNNTAIIDKDSAGCQVFEHIGDFNEMMRLANISKAKYGNNFTYILIDERDYKKRINTIIASISIILAGFLLSRYLFKKL